MTRDVTASTNNVGPRNVSSKGLGDWFSSDEKLRKNREQAVAVTWAVFRKDRELFLVPLLAMALVVAVMGSAGCMGPEGLPLPKLQHGSWG